MFKLSNFTTNFRLPRWTKNVPGSHQLLWLFSKTVYNHLLRLVKIAVPYGSPWFSMFYYGLLLLVTLVLYGLKDTALVSHIWTYQKDYVGASSGFLCPSRPWVGWGKESKTWNKYASGSGRAGRNPQKHSEGGLIFTVKDPVINGTHLEFCNATAV